MAASERDGSAVERAKITTIEEAKQAVIDRYDDAGVCFLYKTRAGRVIMNVYQMFEICGDPILHQLSCGNAELEQEIWQQLDRGKRGADLVKKKKPQDYQLFIEAGRRLLEERRIANGRPNAK